MQIKQSRGGKERKGQGKEKEQKGIKGNERKGNRKLEEKKATEI